MGSNPTSSAKFHLYYCRLWDTPIAQGGDVIADDGKTPLILIHAQCAPALFRRVLTRFCAKLFAREGFGGVGGFEHFVLKL